jgi:hypothetical protein
MDRTYHADMCRAIALGLLVSLAQLTAGGAAAAAETAAPAAKSVAARSAAQRSFESPEAAATALAAAARAFDVGQMLRILGAGARDALLLKDKVAMRSGWSSFVATYERKHAIEAQGADRARLTTGEDGWAFPYPMVRGQDGRWRFDTAAGNEEVVARRVGANELFTIETALAIVDAQREYASRDWDGDGLLVYAARFASTPGRKDGLYWKPDQSGIESPLGPLAARAQREGYGKSRDARGEPVPYHGYYYRLLTRQGPDAPGGTYDYLVRGKLLGGFALIAYPAQYGVTGVMSFIVNHDGVVHQKDLGPDTGRLAREIKAYNPDQTWKEAKKG